MAENKEDSGAEKRDTDDERKADGEEKSKDKDKDKKSDDDEDDEPKKPSPLRKPWVRVTLVVVGLVLLVLLIIWLINYFTYGRYQQSTDNAYIQADQINISSRVSGYVTAVLVNDNQDVKAGQQLATIQTDSYSANLERDRAAIVQAEADVGQSLAQIHQQQAKVAEARQTLGQSQADARQYAASYRFNESQAARYTPLAAAGAETEEKAAQYRSEAKQSAEQLRSARHKAGASAADLAYQQRQIEVLRANLRSARAKVVQQKAQYASDNVDFAATKVVSSIAGRVGNRTVRIGQYLQSGTRLMTIVPITDLYVQANFKETQVGLMRVGQPAKIAVDALGGKEIHGTVASFSPGTGAQFALAPKDNSTGNFTKIVQRVQVKIKIDAGEEARQVLVPGLSVDVSVDTSGAKDDKEAQKEEAKRAEEQYKRQAKEQTDRDRNTRAPGPGSE